MTVTIGSSISIVVEGDFDLTHEQVAEQLAEHLGFAYQENDRAYLGDDGGSVCMLHYQRGGIVYAMSHTDDAYESVRGEGEFTAAKIEVVEGLTTGEIDSSGISQLGIFHTESDAIAAFVAALTA